MATQSKSGLRRAMSQVEQCNENNKTIRRVMMVKTVGPKLSLLKIVLLSWRNLKVLRSDKLKLPPILQ